MQAQTKERKNTEKPAETMLHLAQTQPFRLIMGGNLSEPRAAKQSPLQKAT